jgi:hypothetical protein
MRCADANGGHIGGRELDFARQRSRQLSTRVRKNFADLGLSNLGLAIGHCFRTATDLAALLAAQGRYESARRLLWPVFEQFVEGFDTADLKAAERLLAMLS